MTKAVGALIVLAAISFVSQAAASTAIENFQDAEVVTGGEGTQIYPYGSGTDLVHDSAASFDAGILAGSATVVGDEVQLDPPDTWWDSSYAARSCVELTASDTVAQYPVRVVVDTSTAAGDDLRVVESIIPASSAAPVPHYTESGAGTASTIIWFQATAAPTPRTYCIYFESGAPSASNQFGPFTYTSGQTVSYYTMLDTFTGTGADSRVDVISYVDNNTVSDGTTTVVLAAGASTTFAGLNQHSVITATGPIDASSDRPSKEALLPEGFADQTFTFPTERSTERFFVRSPHGIANVDAVIDGVVVSTTTIGPADGAVEIVASGGPTYVSLRSDGPHILAMHHTTNDRDIFAGVPWFGDALYGVASEHLIVGSIAPTTVDYLNETGATGSIAVLTNNQNRITGNGTGRGNGLAYRLAGTDYFAAIQQRDDNGNESTSFLPERLLSQTFRLPVTANYFTIACPVPATSISVDGAPAGTCAGTGVGNYWSGLGTFAAGTHIEADHPVFAYYETSVSGGSDEHNIFGAKASIPYLRSHATTPTVPTPIVPCGAWATQVLPTSGIFGLVDIDISVDPGESFIYQISFDNGPFVGPDTTAATSFAAGDIVPYVFDGATTIQLRVAFCGEMSVLRSVSIESDLVEIYGDLGLVPQAPITAAGDGPVARVYPALDTTHIAYLLSASPDSYDLGTDVSAAQIQAIGGTITNPAPTFASQPFSLEFTGVSPQTSLLRAAVTSDDGNVRIDVPLWFSISA